MKEQNGFLLTINGWLVAVCLTIVLFLVYYLCLYNPLSSRENDFYLYLDSKPLNQHQDMHLRVYVPKYITNFDDTQLTVTVYNNSNVYSPTLAAASSGSSTMAGRNVLTFMLQGELFDLKTNATTTKKAFFALLNASSPCEQLPEGILEMMQLTYCSDSSANASYAISMRLPVSPQDYRNSSYLKLTFYSDGRDLITWGTDNGCGNLGLSEGEQNKQICIKVNSSGVLEQTAFINLLLPPWSNRLLPLFVIAMVWLAERILVSAQKKINEEMIEMGLWKIMVLSAILISGFLTLFMISTWFPVGSLWGILMIASVVVFFVLALPWGVRQFHKRYLAKIEVSRPKLMVRINDAYQKRNIRALRDLKDWITENLEFTQNDREWIREYIDRKEWEIRDRLAVMVSKVKEDFDYLRDNMEASDVNLEELKNLIIGCYKQVNVNRFGTGVDWNITVLPDESRLFNVDASFASFDGKRQEWQLEEPDPDWIERKITEMIKGLLSRSSLSNKKKSELLGGLLISEDIPSKCVESFSLLIDDKFYEWFDEQCRIVETGNRIHARESAKKRDKRKYLVQIFVSLKNLGLLPEPRKGDWEKILGEATA